MSQDKMLVIAVCAACGQDKGGWANRQQAHRAIELHVDNGLCPVASPGSVPRITESQKESRLSEAHCQCGFRAKAGKRTVEVQMHEHLETTSCTAYEMESDTFG